ncbi:hypothetical protein Tco_0922612 [Tanacetum coccineum]|uniref:Retrotransposon gag domain-containing protein n=1 Tax=Tanacetum coccineum TaxID=301880 RepID=A0ABQ5D116_9ASTR
MSSCIIRWSPYTYVTLISETGQESLLGSDEGDLYDGDVPRRFVPYSDPRRTRGRACWITPADGGDGDDEPSVRTLMNDAAGCNDDEEPFSRGRAVVIEAFESVGLHPHLDHLRIRIPFTQIRLRYRQRDSDVSCDASHPHYFTYFPRTNIPELRCSLGKRAWSLLLTAPGYEIGESSAAGAARQPGPTPAVDTWDEIVEAMMEIASSEERSAAIREVRCKHVEAGRRLQPWFKNRGRGKCPSNENALHCFEVPQHINFKALKESRWPDPMAKKMESVFLISNCAITNQVKFASCTLQGSALTWWNSHGQDQKLESEYWNLKLKWKVCRCLPDMNLAVIKASKLSLMQEAIEFATDMIDKKVDHCTVKPMSLRSDCPKAEELANQGSGWKWLCYVARAFVVGSAAKYHAVIVCDEKLVRVPFGDKTLIFHGDDKHTGHKSRLNIISCTRTQKYLLEGCPIFLAQVTMKEAEDKSKEKKLEEVPIVQDFLEGAAASAPVRHGQLIDGSIRDGGNYRQANEKLWLKRRSSLIGVTRQRQLSVDKAKVVLCANYGVTQMDMKTLSLCDASNQRVRAVLMQREKSEWLMHSRQQRFMRKIYTIMIGVRRSLLCVHSKIWIRASICWAKFWGTVFTDHKSLQTHLDQKEAYVDENSKGPEKKPGKRIGTACGRNNVSKQQKLVTSLRLHRSDCSMKPTRRLVQNEAEKASARDRKRVFTRWEKVNPRLYETFQVLDQTLAVPSDEYILMINSFCGRTSGKSFEREFQEAKRDVVLTIIQSSSELQEEVQMFSWEAGKI